MHCVRRFDDVVRITAAPVETKRTTLELDDRKPQQVGWCHGRRQVRCHAVHESRDWLGARVCRRALGSCTSRSTSTR